MNRKKDKSNKIYKMTSLVLLVIAIALWFVVSPLETDNENIFQGMETISYLNATFGYTIKDSNVTVLIFSFLNFLPLLLMVVALAASVLSHVLPKVLKEDKAKLITIGSTILAVILLFFVKSFLRVDDALLIEEDIASYKFVFVGFIVPILLIGSLMFRYFNENIE